MATPDIEYADFEGKRIAYWSVGRGAPVVLIHGSFATSAAWKRMAASLNPDTCRAIAMDLPGWGNSEPAPLDHPALVDYEARAVDAVASHAVASLSGGGSVHLAGHSHGGTIHVVGAAKSGLLDEFEVVIRNCHAVLRGEPALHEVLVARPS